MAGPIAPPELDVEDGPECVFPFIHNGKTYNNCTTDDFPNDPNDLRLIMPWCAIKIEPGTEIPQTDNWWEHRAECQAGCPGTGELKIAIIISYHHVLECQLYMKY